LVATVQRTVALQHVPRNGPDYHRRRRSICKGRRIRRRVALAAFSA
jgi:hypothetical protein